MTLLPGRHCERPQHDNRRGDGQQSDPILKVVGPVEEQNETRRQESQPDEFEAARPLVLIVGGQECIGEPQRQDADRNVDEEQPAPRCELQDGPGDHRAEQGRKEDGHGGEADDPGEAFARGSDPADQATPQRAEESVKARKQDR